MGITDYFNNECRAVAPTSAQADTPVKAQAATPAKAQAATPAKAPAGVKKFGMSIKEWLAAMDDSGFLVQYHDGIVAKLDSLEQIVDVYVKGGELDKKFF